MVKRLYPEQPIVGVGVVILKQGNLLLGKRLNEPAKGKWSIPGGVVELGETLEQTAIREAKEETCLDVSNPLLLDVVDTIDFDANGKVMYHFVIADYLVTPTTTNEPSAASDAAELQWVPFNEVENYDLTRSFRFFFQRNREKLEKVSSVQ